MDLGRSGKLGGVEIDWEQTAVYPFKVDVSTNGVDWKLLEDRNDSKNTSGRDKITSTATARYLRVTVGGMPAGQWASIRELLPFDTSGNPVKPISPTAVSTQNPSSAEFNDSAWRQLDLPHDWGNPHFPALRSGPTVVSGASPKSERPMAERGPG